MPASPGKKFRIITIIYWLLLSYIVAALVWWFITLEKQNRIITELRHIELSSNRRQYGAEEYTLKSIAINKVAARNSLKHIAEGVTVLILTSIGAFFVYRSVRKQFRLQAQQQSFMMAITHELTTPISVSIL